MDLDVALPRHRRLRAHRAARPARHARAPRRRPPAVRLRRGHAAPARALGRPDRARGDLPHPLPRRPRARAARDAEDLRPARAASARSPCTGPPACGGCSRCSRPLWGTRPSRCRWWSSRPNDELERDGYRDRRLRGGPRPAARCGYALVEDRPSRATSIPSGAARAGRGARPRLRPPPARRDRGRRDARAGDGRAAARPQGGARRRHARPAR